LKYQIEYCPNPDVIIIHVNQRLIVGSILRFEMMDSEYEKKELEKEAINLEGLSNFCRIVTELDGMEETVSFRRYNIQLSKAALFAWDDLIPNVLAALQTFVARDETIEKIGQPKRPTAEYLESLRKRGCDV
jgi:hypothetical protein